jgi:hypothetical protein
MAVWDLNSNLDVFGMQTFLRGKIENLTKNHLKIISSETTRPIGPKCWWNGL